MSEEQPKPEAEQEQIEGQQNTGNVQQPNVAPYLFVEKLWDSALRIHWVKHEKNLGAGHSTAHNLGRSRSHAWQSLWLLLMCGSSSPGRVRKQPNSFHLNCHIPVIADAYNLRWRNSRTKQVQVREYRDECDGGSVPVLRLGRGV